MASYKVTIKGQTYKVDAPDEATLKQAVTKLQEQLGPTEEQQTQRDAITAGAVQGAKEQRAQYLTENMAQIEPRLTSAYNVDPRAAAVAGATPLMGAAMAPQMAAARALPGVIGGAATAMQAHPVATGAILGAAPGLMSGSLTHAASGAVIGAMGGGAPTVAGKVLQYLPKAASVARSVSALASEVPEAAPVAASAPTVNTLLSGTKSVAPLTAESVLEKVATLKKMGFSRGQIISSLKETHGMKASQATKVVDLIEGMQ